MGVALAVVLVACGGGQEPADPAPPPGPAPMPTSPEARHAVLRELAQDLFDATVAADADRLLVPVDELALILDPDGVQRISALRMAIHARVELDPARHGAFGNTELYGLCVLGARDEPAHSPIGLQSEGWILERALIVGERAGGQRLGAWFEGTFVYAGGRFRAIDLRRVEDPRWEHSDLELVTCDMQVGLGDPLDVGMVTD
jgi:hypothetical protein